MTEGNGSTHFSVWRKIAMASWPARKDSWIRATLDIDAEGLLQYIDAVRSSTGVHVTPAHVVGRAGARVIEALPGLNGREEPRTGPAFVLFRIAGNSGQAEPATRRVSG